MRTEYHHWYSCRTSREMGLVVYGHWGPPMLAFPTSGGDELEMDRQGMIAALADYIEAGRVKIVTVNANSGDAFYNKGAHPFHRSYMQAQYDAYVRYEVVPFIRRHYQSDDIGVATMGALYGYHFSGKTHLAGFGQDIAAASLQFFESYYGIPYPGDKLDLLAIPDFASGAMENLGAITFRETAGKSGGDFLRTRTRLQCPVFGSPHSLPVTHSSAHLRAVPGPTARRRVGAILASTGACFVDTPARPLLISGALGDKRPFFLHGLIGAAQATER